MQSLFQNLSRIHRVWQRFLGRETELMYCMLDFQDLNKRQGLALLTKMGESVKYVTGGYKLRARPVEFAAMGDYLDVFTQKLGTIDRIAQRIIKEQSGKEHPVWHFERNYIYSFFHPKGTMRLFSEL